MDKNRIFKEKGITLIALVVTIVVLLILAGVSIAVLTGENGLLNRATESKTTSYIAQFKEDARLEHLAQQVDKQAYGTALSYKELIKTLKAKNYTIIQPPTAIESITLSQNEGNIDVNSTTPITVEVNINYGASEEGTNYLYAEGKYYALTPSNTNGLEVASTPSDIDMSGGAQGSETITAVSSATSVATANVSGNTISISKASGAAKDDTAEITVQVNGTDFTNNTVAIKIIQLSSLDSVNVASLTTDGASLLTATLTGGNIATSSDVQWSIKNASDSNKLSVTKNGIVKCGTETTGNTPVTVVCTGANKSIEIPVISLAKIVYTNAGNANTTITGATTGFAYNNPIIPVGFSAIDTENAKWNLSVDKTTANPQYNNGLVIMDEKGNQFVWVPIIPNEVPYAKWCTKNIAYNDSNISDEIPIAPDTTTTYGGFWIGRYEAGIDVDAGSYFQTTANATPRNGEYTPVIVEGAIPWNYISQTQAKANAEIVYTNTSYAQSGIISGIQWDTALKFMQVKGKDKNQATINPDDSTTWGNYSNSAISSIDRFPLGSTNDGASWGNATAKSNNSNILLRTGASTQTQVLNISDMAGNVWEWTSEIYNSSKRVLRGGCYASNGSSFGMQAPYRNDFYVSNAYNYFGFRVVLYVK